MELQATHEASSTPLSPVKQAVLELRKLRSQLAALEAASAARDEPIAVLGMAVRLGGGIHTLDGLWNLLAEERSCVSEVPPERWNIDDYYAADPTAAGKISSRYGAFLKDVDRFDAEFFGISPREAERMDPQQRLLLEVAWEALEDAGIAPADIAGTQAGVYLGLANSDYGRMLLNDADAIDPHTVAGGALSVAAGRLSYALNLRGPAIVVDTACSSSLVALHLACNSLRAGETDLAIVGGANLMLLPEGSVGFSRTRMLAADGRCKTFDRDADGYVRGEGCVALTLMRLSDAQRSRHRVYALYRGSAINQDGRSAGLTAPNGPAQESVVRAALKAAKVEPNAVSYVECHGTGTALGDPIEVQALAQVFTTGRDPNHPLLIGSVKAHLGHLEAAAGLAGLVKTALALDRSRLPGQIHLRHLTPYVAWDTMPLQVVRSATEWKRGREPRFAGVSSFGFCGTNAHVVLQEAPAETGSLPDDAEEMHVLCLSGKTPEALRQLALSYQSWLGTTEDKLGDICFTANAGRAHHRERLSFCGATISELKGQLGSWLESDELSLGRRPGEIRGPVGAESPDLEARTPTMQRVREAYLAGETIEWADVYKGREYRRISLPHYPFQRKSYWVKPLAEVSVAASKVTSSAPIAEGGKRDALLDERSDAAVVRRLPPEERYGWMFVYVTCCIRGSLRLDGESPLRPRDRLTELGMDSLIALELRARLSTGLELGDRIASTIVFDAGTVEELVRIVLEAVFPAAAQPPSEAERSDSAGERLLSTEELTGLSEEQVELLIAASIERLDQGSRD